MLKEVDCEKYIGERITELRYAKGISSERELSRRLGKNELYIQHITNGKQNISLNSLCEICKFFGITPAEFFDPNYHNPDLLKEVTLELEKLTEEDLRQIYEIVKKVAKSYGR